MFNFIIIKKLLNFWSRKSETDINIDIILHLKKNSLGGWYPIDTKSKSFSRLHPTVNTLLIPLSTLGDRYVKQQFNRPTQRINIKAYKPIPRHPLSKRRSNQTIEIRRSRRSFHIDGLVTRTSLEWNTVSNPYTVIQGWTTPPPAYAASRNLSQKRGTEPIYPYVQYGSFQIGCWRRSVLNEKGPKPCLGVQSFWRVAKGEQEIWKIEQSSSRGRGRSMVNLDESIFASWKKEKEKKNGSATWRFVKRLFKG